MGGCSDTCTDAFALHRVFCCCRSLHQLPIGLHNCTMTTFKRIGTDHSGRPEPHHAAIARRLPAATTCAASLSSASLPCSGGCLAMTAPAGSTWSHGWAASDGVLRRHPLPAVAATGLTWLASL